MSFIDRDWCEQHESCQRVLLCRCAVILLAARRVGPHARRLNKDTGVPLHVIQTASIYLREAGLWAKSEVHYEWIDDFQNARQRGVSGLLQDSAIAAGLLRRSSRDGYEPRPVVPRVPACSQTWDELIRDVLSKEFKTQAIRERRSLIAEAAGTKRIPRPTELSLDWRPDSSDRFTSIDQHDRLTHYDEWDDPTFDAAEAEIDIYIEARRRLIRSGSRQFADVRTDKAAVLVPTSYIELSGGRRWVRYKWPGVRQ